MHPYFPQHEQLAWDRAHGIATQAWSPLGRANQLLQDPVLKTIAQRVSKSVVQVILRWHHQLGAIPLPKATSPQRQHENLDIFGSQLSSDDMAAIARLARPDGRSFDQNPAYYEEL